MLLFPSRTMARSASSPIVSIAFCISSNMGLSHQQVTNKEVNLPDVVMNTPLLWRSTDNSISSLAVDLSLSWCSYATPIHVQAVPL